MASQTRSPSVAAEESNGMPGGWVDVDNIKASDDQRATYTWSVPTDTNFLVAKSFGFSIPSGATIDGIELSIERRYTGSAGVGESEVRVKTDSVTGVNKAGGAWPASDTVATYGGAADLWGQSWTPGDVNGSDFRAILVAQVDNGKQAEVDHMQVTVYYTPAAGSPRSQAVMIG